MGKKKAAKSRTQKKTSLRQSHQAEKRNKKRRPGLDDKEEETKKQDLHRNHGKRKRCRTYKPTSKHHNQKVREVQKWGRSPIARA